MSATLNIMATVNDTTGGVSISANKTLQTVGTALDLRILEIGTVEEEIAISSEITSCGLCVIQNMDGENFVDVGFETGVYPIRIPAGLFAIVPLTPATSSLFLQADTGACDVKLYVHEA